MAVGFSNTNKPLNPRGNDASPKGYNRAELYSGKALDFDGVNDYVDGGTLDITGYTQMSVSFYMNVDTTTQDFRLISIRYSGADDIRIFHSVTIGGGVLNFSLDDGDVDNIGVDFETNQWYHVVMTHDGTTLKAYFNGVEQKSIASTFDYANADGLFYIGRYTGGSVTYYDGEASNVKIFNTALTAAQVADLYNNPEKIVPTGVADSALKLWLPMQEGAGTTAYDGSGNGNHGTISGATWTHGIGAPVSQTAVIDWNKGQNLMNKSESFLSSYYSRQNIITTADQITAPDGDDNGYKFVASNNNTFHLCSQNASASAGVYTQSVFAKAGEYEHVYLVLRTDGGAKRYGVKFDLSDGSFVDDATLGTPTQTGYNITSVGNGWYRCSVTSNHSSGNVIAVFGPSNAGNVNGINNNFQGDGTSGIYAWGLQVEPATSVGAYIPNPSATRITSDVLLPQGLTTGRDITGVNLFENVRKQGALNLDGNSWGKVHPNNSFAFGTGAFSMEAWAKLEYVNTGSYANEIMALNDSDDWAIKTLSSGVSFKAGSTALSHTKTLDNSWAHIVGVRNSDGSMKLYINGAEEENAAAGSSTDSLSATNELRLATDTTEGSRTYKDQIAQPRIYNRALTAAEVLQNYNSGKSIYTNS